MHISCIDYIHMQMCINKYLDMCIYTQHTYIHTYIHTYTNYITIHYLHTHIHAVHAHERCAYTHSMLDIWTYHAYAQRITSSHASHHTTPHHTTTHHTQTIHIHTCNAPIQTPHTIATRMCACTAHTHRITRHYTTHILRAHMHCTYTHTIRNSHDI